VPRNLKATHVGIAGLPQDVGLWWKDLEETTYETLKPVPTICPYSHDDFLESRLTYVGKIRTYKRVKHRTAVTPFPGGPAGKLGIEIDAGYSTDQAPRDGGTIDAG
jgi:hypothetical protein